MPRGASPGALFLLITLRRVQHWRVQMALDICFFVRMSMLKLLSVGRGLDPGRCPVQLVLQSLWNLLALGSTQPPIEWVPGALFRGLSCRGVKLTTHLQLVPGSRKCGSIHPLPHRPSCCSA
jgi:hypothetical protein